MFSISRFVATQVRHRFGEPPKRNKALQSIIAAELLIEKKFGVTTVTAAAFCTGVSRAAVQNALIVLQTEDVALVMDVLYGRVSLAKAAVQARNRARLVTSFRTASADDRVAFARVVGAATLFDTAIVPAL